jgi:hypothetical protein
MNRGDRSNFVLGLVTDLVFFERLGRENTEKAVDYLLNDTVEGT